MVTATAGPSRPGPGIDRRSQGSVTAELAVALPSVVLVLAVLLTLGQLITAQIRCVDAARAAARMAARGESDARARAAGRTAAPDGAAVALARSGDTVAVEVSIMLRLPLPGGPELPVRASSVALVEQPGGTVGP